MAPKDSQNGGRDFAKRKQPDAEFARNTTHYRQDAAQRQTAGIVFTHRPKIRFFVPQGRLVAPIQVKKNFTSISADGRECGPQNIKKFPLFGKESPRRGDSLDRFPKFLGAFKPLTILR